MEPGLVGAVVGVVGPTRAIKEAHVAIKGSMIAQWGSRCHRRH